MRKTRGITLIALVITIIIIIILATVTINMAFGDNGLIKQAELAKDLTTNSMEHEQGSMANLIAYMNEVFGGAGTAEPGTPEEPEIPNGTIEFEEVQWVGDGTATVVVNTSSTGYRLQYQVNSTEGIWQETENGQPIPNLKHGDKIFARLYDEETETESEHVIKDILDETPPEVNISTSNLTYNSVTLNVTASDGQSGLADTETYAYYLGDVQQVTNTTKSHNYTGLNAQTQYTLKVVVKDRAGKTTEKSTTITTNAVPTVATTLKAGDYVYYLDGTGVTRKCAVLYDNSSGFGVQIIPLETV